MALATLESIKAIAKEDANIQSLHVSDPAVVIALGLAEKMATESRFFDKAFEAQSYYAAHILSLAFTVAGGQGPKSSESIGGISESFTLPYLNQSTVIASTQYGLMYLEMRRACVVNFRMIKPI